MKKISITGYYVSLILALSLFLSVKLQNVAGIILMLLFVISLGSKENRNKFSKKIDKKIAYSLLLFSLIPYVIALIDGGLNKRIDMDDYIKFLLFFPLVYFIESKKQFFTFLKILLVGATISLLITLGIFIKNYNSWKSVEGFSYPRVYFALPTQDFANIMSYVLLFILSFILFYKSEDKSKNLKIKIFLSLLMVLNIFILLVNRSKMVYICLFPTIIYILWEKNKKYILGFIILCCGGYFILPKSISERLQYIVKFREDPSSNLRIIFWKGAMKVVEKNWLIGMKSEERWNFTKEYYKSVGLYDYVVQYYVNFDKDMRSGLNTHSMYFQYIVYFGLGFIFLVNFFFIIIPSRLLKLQFNKKGEKNSKISKYVALEIALKSTYICYLIQGLTEININNKSMIVAFSIILYMIHYIYKESIKKFI